ncbi:hypothetical protein EIN_065670 [Entamoeba invadens IP1]|uniref:Uncharacterized protein n=1 Tax=Entamoeba invadens IP1 TaxID=370355 RepID=A0A0A1TVB1_ENTIV|nr:hypothetical protein EIN_065670 [Entamoeba invadens IP1]ELP84292.1 hypothetical protein EIN_065670 [Entamoeba invadens IP1]|eukprot:XP_004183638.1 hypothetical protein EIN_065670 [Entamoeba invadens IP1]
MEMEQKEFVLINFPGFSKDPSAPLDEQVNSMCKCFGGTEAVQKYIRGESGKLQFTFRPSDLFSSTFPVQAEKCKNKILVTRKNGNIAFKGKVTKEINIDSLAPFQVIDRSSFRLILPSEQPVDFPFEINTGRTTRVFHPAQVNFQQGKERTKMSLESHPHSLPFRKSKLRGKKTEDSQVSVTSTLEATDQDLESQIDKENSEDYLPKSTL